MRTPLAALLLLALASAVAVAATPAVPVKVTADTFTVEQDSNRATFTGNVEIVRTGLSMWADVVVVHYGKGGQQDIDRLEASGNVRIKTREQEATGKRAVYDPRSMILTLSEDVTVSGAQGTVRGPELTIDLANDSSVFKSNSGGRVTGVFTPQ